ncbi:MAG: hypothetical protein PHY48_08320 [Candidatus Cloacimonetes bacterium]|nr:hypothetical protein [Candidatus Cloacimonadota bacterium]
MPRSKIFLTIVLILLLVNAAFFLAWYGLGLRGQVRKILASQLGKAIKGKVHITELHFSDRQLLAEGISIATADSSITVNVKSLRAQYNLLRFIVSGFKPSKLLQDIDVYQPVIRLNISPKPKKPKAKKPFEIPDLTQFFSNLRIEDGAAMIQVDLPLKIVTQGNLHIYEEFSNINLKTTNKKHSDVVFTALGSRNGKLSLRGVLDKGAIREAKAEIEAFRPLSISHPDIINLQTEISAVATVSQSAAGAPFDYQAKTQIWGTQLLFASKYPVKIPFIGADTDGETLTAQLTKSTVGNSNIRADISLSGLNKEIRVDSATVEGGLDLAMIYPDLLGLVGFTASAKGTIKDPTATINASSSMLGYNQYILHDIALSGNYADDELHVKLPQARFQNQEIVIDGSFNTQSMALNAKVLSKPVIPNSAPYEVNADIDLYAELIDKYPYLDAKINQLDFKAGKANVSGVNGYVKLVPVSEDKNYYVDANLQGDKGYSLSVVGDILDRNLLIDAAFTDLAVSQLYAENNLKKLNPIVGGSLKAIMTGNDIYAQTSLDIAIEQPIAYSTHLEGLGSINLQSLQASLQLDGSNGALNEQDVSFALSTTMKNENIYVHGFKVNDLVSLSGRLNLKDMQDIDFALALQNLTSREIVRFFPSLDTSIPDFKGLSLFADYNRDGLNNLNADLELNEIDLLAITPLSLKLGVNGTINSIDILGEVTNNQKKLIDLSGLASLKPNIDISATAVFDSLNIQEVLVSSPVLGSIAGSAGIDIRNFKSKSSKMDLMADLRASQIVAGELKIDTAVIKAKQSPQELVVDSLYVLSSGLFEIAGSGAIDYNATKNEYFEGTQKLHLKVDGQLFPWLKNLTSFIEEAKGYSSLDVVLGTRDDQFTIYDGNLDIRDGFLRLKDQSEPLENINIKGILEKDRIIIEHGQVKMGEGSLVFSNVFEADSSEHFMLGFIDLGIMRLMIEEPGISANVPLFTPPKTLSNIILKGQDSRYATVKGPFDQMKISAAVQLSNASALYPPNTANLLKLAASLRDATSKNSTSETAPLPFTLDVMLTLGENISYVTYPTHLNIQPGGFLHLLYDGQTFSVKDANFSSERGTIDIFGTVFQVEKVDITMVESQDLLSVEGLFNKRAPDGSMVTLTVTTSTDLTKSFSERLQFSLTSDNPEDRSISQILSRLTYSQSGDVAEETKGIPLQDEALTMLSGNLDSSLLTPILSPVENFIRRKLKLDGFSISAGFIQNLYTQYSTDPSQLADNTDMNHFTTDIAQFSSSILLNNLSLSMSKYLGRKFFLDYKLDLQEATDLQKKTKLLVSHETSVRYLLPYRLRLAYTFKYLPQENDMSHEIMLQRSFRFWGL